MRNILCIIDYHDWRNIAGCTDRDNENAWWELEHCIRCEYSRIWMCVSGGKIGTVISYRKYSSQFFEEHGAYDE